MFWRGAILVVVLVLCGPMSDADAKRPWSPDAKECYLQTMSVLPDLLYALESRDKKNFSRLLDKWRNHAELLATRLDAMIYDPRWTPQRVLKLCAQGR